MIQKHGKAENRHSSPINGDTGALAEGWGGDKVLPPAQLQRLWDRTNGKAWEPPNVEHPSVLALIHGGWVKRCPMRCGFEAFDTGVAWTDAAKAYFKKATA